MSWEIYLPVVVSAAISALMIWRDPRRLRCAVMSTFTLMLALFLVMSGLMMGLAYRWEYADAWVLLGVFFLMLVTIVVLAVFLINAGIMLIRKEGASLSHMLSLLLGMGLIFYLVAGILSIILSAIAVFTVLVLLIFPVFYLSFMLVAYILYSAVYGWWAARFAAPADAVVVLGSGLSGGEVTPLLARRLDLGIACVERSRKLDKNPLLITSGGQGGDELVAEGAAMRQYLLTQGIEGDRVLVEDRATNTEENLRYSVCLVGDSGLSAQWMAVTSDYHAFRAAVELRGLGLRGNAVGAKTPRYFWASAKLREYVAIMKQHVALNVTILGVTLLPLCITAVVALTNG